MSITHAERLDGQNYRARKQVRRKDSVNSIDPIHHQCVASPLKKIQNLRKSRYVKPFLALRSVTQGKDEL
jgi:hypothetical protein